MPREAADIIVVEYSGPQGAFELEMVENASRSLSKARNRRRLANTRRSSVVQHGGVEATCRITYVPERLDRQVNWTQAWLNDEKFELTFEIGIDGEAREKAVGCYVTSIDDSASSEGDATKEVEVFITELFED